jgi:hypothetical protein
VSQRLFGIDQIVVSPPDSIPSNIARVNEIGYDGLCRSLGNTNLCCYISPADSRIARYADQNMAMVGQECPLWSSRLSPRNVQIPHTGNCSGFRKSHCVFPERVDPVTRTPLSYVVQLTKRNTYDFAKKDGGSEVTDKKERTFRQDA